jgi:membrane associated rhomboid family serine protease
MKIKQILEPTSIKEVKVCVTYSFILIVAFLLRSIGAIDISCNNDFLSIYGRQFVETELSFLTVNLFSFYSLSELELLIGSKTFFFILNVSIIMNSLLESKMHQINPDLKCSDGFTTTLYTLIVFDLIVSKNFSLSAITSFTLIIFVISFKNKQVSLVDHSIGAFTGIVMGLLYLRFTSKQKIRLLHEKNIF